MKIKLYILLILSFLTMAFNIKTNADSLNNYYISKEGNQYVLKKDETVLNVKDNLSIREVIKTIKTDTSLNDCNITFSNINISPYIIFDGDWGKINLYGEISNTTSEYATIEIKDSVELTSYLNITTTVRNGIIFRYNSDKELKIINSNLSTTSGNVIYNESNGSIFITDTTINSESGICINNQALGQITINRASLFSSSNSVIYNKIDGIIYIDDCIINSKNGLELIKQDLSITTLLTISIINTQLSSNNTLINNLGNSLIYLDNSNLTSLNGVCIKNKGILEIKDSFLETNNYAIENDGYLYLSTTTITTNYDTAIILYENSFSYIDKTNITNTFGSCIINNSKNILEISLSVLNGFTKGIIINDTSSNIIDATITTNSFCIEINSSCNLKILDGIYSSLEDVIRLTSESSLVTIEIEDGNFLNSINYYSIYNLSLGTIFIKGGEFLNIYSSLSKIVLEEGIITNEIKVNFNCLEVNNLNTTFIYKINIIDTTSYGIVVINGKDNLSNFEILNDTYSLITQNDDIILKKVFTVLIKDKDDLIDTLQVDYGAKIKLDYNLSKEGYLFVGFSNNGVLFDCLNDVVVDNLVLNATWASKTFEYLITKNDLYYTVTGLTDNSDFTYTLYTHKEITAIIENIRVEAMNKDIKITFVDIDLGSSGISFNGALGYTNIYLSGSITSSAKNTLTIISTKAYLSLDITNTSTDGYCLSNSSSYVEILSGTLNSQTNGIYNSSSNDLHIKGGIINAFNYAIYNNLNGKIYLSGGEINSRNIGIYNHTQSTLYIDNVSINTTSFAIYNNAKGLIEYKSGNITTTNTSIYSKSSLEFKMSGGSITSLSGDCLEASLSGSIQVSGGSLYSNNYAIKIDSININITLSNSPFIEGIIKANYVIAASLVSPYVYSLELLTYVSNKIVVLNGKNNLDNFSINSTEFKLAIENESLILITAFLVTFNTNGGSIIQSQVVETGSKATKPVDPIRNNYLFVGFYYQDNLFDFDTLIYDNIELIAVWAIKEYSYIITYSKNQFKAVGKTDITDFYYTLIETSSENTLFNSILNETLTPSLYFDNVYLISLITISNFNSINLSGVIKSNFEINIDVVCFIDDFSFNNKLNITKQAEIKNSSIQSLNITEVVSIKNSTLNKVDCLEITLENNINITQIKADLVNCSNVKFEKSIDLIIKNPVNNKTVINSSLITNFNLLNESFALVLINNYIVLKKVHKVIFENYEEVFIIDGLKLEFKSLSKDGYIFLGWEKDLTLWDFKDGVFESFTLKEKFTLDKPTLNNFSSNLEFEFKNDYYKISLDYIKYDNLEYSFTWLLGNNLISNTDYINLKYVSESNIYKVIINVTDNIETTSITKEVNISINKKYIKIIEPVFENVTYKETPNIFETEYGYYTLDNNYQAGLSYIDYEFIPYDELNYEYSKRSGTVLIDVLKQEGNGIVFMDSFTYKDELDPYFETSISEYSEVTYLYRYEFNPTFQEEKLVNAGTYFIKAILHETNNYKEFVTEEVKYTVYKKEGSILFSIPSVNYLEEVIVNLSYDEEYENVYIYYKNKETWVSEKPTQAGIYYAYILLEECSNYLEYKSEEISFEIFKIDGFGEVSLDSFTYLDEKLPTAVNYTLEYTSISFEYLVDGVWVSSMPIIPNDYKVRAIFEETNNYNLFISNDLSFSIYKKEQDEFSVLDIEDCYYGVSPIEIITIGVLSLGKITYTLVEGNCLIEDNFIIITSSCKVVILVEVESDLYYKSASSYVEFNIFKKVIIVTPDKLSKLHNQIDPILTFTYSEALVNDDFFSGSLEREEGEEIGVYFIKLGTLSLNDYYTIEFVSDVTFEIIARNIEVKKPNEVNFKIIDLIVPLKQKETYSFKVNLDYGYDLSNISVYIKYFEEKILLTPENNIYTVESVIDNFEVIIEGVTINKYVINYLSSFEGGSLKAICDGVVIYPGEKVEHGKKVVFVSNIISMYSINYWIVNGISCEVSKYYIVEEVYGNLEVFVNVLKTSSHLLSDSIYSLSGIVDLSDIVVVIYKGATFIGSSVTDINGFYKISNIPSGYYNISFISNDYVNTQLIQITEDTTFDYSFKNMNLEIEVLNDLVLDTLNIYDEFSEKDVFLQVKSSNEDLDELSIMSFEFDFYVDGNKVTNTNNLITFVFYLKDFDKEIIIYRMHEKVLEVITTIPNEYGEYIEYDGTYLYINVNRYSLYTISYIEKPNYLLDYSILSSVILIAIFIIYIKIPKKKRHK